MASETEIRPRASLYTAAWPPHDTEESILGTNLHQTAITNLRWGINDIAHLRAEPGQPDPWQALSQTILLGCKHADGSSYRTYPDVFVYPRPIDPNRSSVALEVDGPPMLIIEVLSESTYEADLDLVRGKGYSYERAGVREYLALDPSGAFVPERGRAWRLVNGVYHPWEPDAHGRWQSAHIDVAIGLEGVRATVYRREGERQLREGEGAEERARTRAELTRKEAEIAELRHLLDEARGKQ